MLSRVATCVKNVNANMEEYLSLTTQKWYTYVDHLLLKTKRIYIATNAPSGGNRFGEAEAEAEAEERRSHSLTGTQPDTCVINYGMHLNLYYPLLLPSRLYIQLIQLIQLIKNIFV